MSEYFDFDHPCAIDLEANFFNYWDDAATKRFVAIREGNRRPRPPMKVIQAYHALVEASLDGKLEAKEMAACKMALDRGGMPGSLPPAEEETLRRAQKCVYRVDLAQTMVLNWLIL